MGSGGSGLTPLPPFFSAVWFRRSERLRASEVFLQAGFPVCPDRSHFCEEVRSESGVREEYHDRAVQRLRAHLHRFVRDRRGGILSLTMITLPLLLSMAAVVVDLGIIYIAKTKSETAALYAAEAGAERLPDIAAAEGLARTAALAHLSDTGYAETSEVVTSATGTEITVTVTMETRTWLADFAGIGRLDTSSTVTRP